MIHLLPPALINNISDLVVLTIEWHFVGGHFSVWVQVSACAGRAEGSPATSWPTSPSPGGSWTSRTPTWPAGGTAGSCWAWSRRRSRSWWSSSSQSSAPPTETSGSVSGGTRQRWTAARTAPNSTTGQTEANPHLGGWERVKRSRDEIPQRTFNTI